MLKDNPIKDQLDEFSKIVDDVDNIEVKLNDKDKAIMLINTLPSSYENLKDAMIFSKTAFTYDEVDSSVKTKDL